MPTCRAFLLALVSCAGVAGAADAQPSYTYHLHNEQTISYDGRDLRSSGPDSKMVLLSTSVLPTMVNKTTTLRIFQLPAGEPALGPEMPGGTTVTFTLWMRLTAARGVVYPAAATTNMYPGGHSGSVGPYLSYCAAWDPTPLTTTLTPYMFSCTISGDKIIHPTDRFTLWVAFHTQAYTPANGKKGGMAVELGIEGKLDFQADSRIVVTTPTP